jgi:hypothetical protein
MKKIISLALCALLAGSFSLIAQGTDSTTLQNDTQKVQTGTTGCCKKMKKNCPMMNGEKMDKASIEKKMANCPMMKDKTAEQKEKMIEKCIKMQNMSQDDKAAMMKKCSKMKNMTVEQKKKMMANCPMMKNKNTAPTDNVQPKEDS